MAIGHCGTEAFKVVNTVCDKNERILILDPELSGTNLLINNFYNPNIEPDQLFIYSIIQNYLKNLMIITKKHYFWR